MSLPGLRGAGGIGRGAGGEERKRFGCFWNSCVSLHFLAFAILLVTWRTLVLFVGGFADTYCWCCFLRRHLKLFQGNLSPSIPARIIRADNVNRKCTWGHGGKLESEAAV